MYLYGTESDWEGIVSACLGQQTVEIVVNTDDDSNRPRPRHGRFTIHKLLLARYSRLFNAKFPNLMDQEILAEVMWNCDQLQPAPDLNHLEVPKGYVPSTTARIATWRAEIAHGTREDSSDLQSEEVITLPDERSRVFGVFVHWLYARELCSKTLGFSVRSAAHLAALYRLAERLEVPLLRRECYRKIRQLYQSGKSLPVPAEVRLVVEESSKISLLRKYYVSIVAHAVIQKDRAEAVNNALDAHPDFARDVLDEVMSRIRSEGDSVDPNKDSAYETDDSQSDFEPAEYEYEDEDEPSPSEPDSVDWMRPSSDEDDDSLGAKSETAESASKSTANGRTPPVRCESDADSVGDNRSKAEGSPPATEESDSDSGTSSDVMPKSQLSRDDDMYTSEAKEAAVVGRKAKATEQNALIGTPLSNEREFQEQSPSEFTLNPWRTESTTSNSTLLKISQHKVHAKVSARSSTTTSTDGGAGKRKRDSTPDAIEVDRDHMARCKVQIIDLSTSGDSPSEDSPSEDSGTISDF